MYADLSLSTEEHPETPGLEDAMKNEGSMADRLDVLDNLFQEELFERNSCEKMQGRVTEEPNSAYNTSELSLGTRIPERDHQTKSDQMLT